MSDFDEPDQLICDLFLYALLTTISDNALGVVSDYQKCLSDIHTRLDVSIILISQKYPSCLNIKYAIVFDFDLYSFKFNSLNEYTSKLSKMMNKIVPNEIIFN